MIEQALPLPCGVTLVNRLCKSAMTEGLASARGRATPALNRLYATWAAGGAALDDALRECLDSDGPFFLDVRVAAEENCFPMMPAGRGHDEILLAADRPWRPRDAVDRPAERRRRSVPAPHR